MTCEIDGCANPPRTAGSRWCQKHYFRFRRHGDPTVIARPVPGPCQTVGCTKRARTRGHCGVHDMRIRATGSDHAERPVGDRRHQRLVTVGYDAAHVRLQTDRGSASDYSCATCGRPAAQWAYDHADPRQLVENGLAYSLEASHYLPLCTSCHRKLDSNRPRGATGSILLPRP